MSISQSGTIIACHECDHLYRYEAIPGGGKASCRRCGALLYLQIPDSLDRCIALYLTSLILFIIANSYPFLSLELGGRIEHNTLISSGIAMYQMGMSDLAIVIFLTSICFPLLTIIGMLYLLIPLRMGYRPPASGPIYRLVEAINPWSLVSVFMLAVLISIVKLQDLANVIPGISLYAFVGVLVSFAAARANFDASVLWAQDDYPQPEPESVTSLISCHTCGLVLTGNKAAGDCPRCTTPLHYRKKNSITRTWALLFTATILIIPANVYPVMTVIRFGQGEPSTIMSGVLHLISAGMWGLAMIVFIASIVIPVMKLLILAYLLISVQNRSSWRPRDRTRLYRITEVVGAWSMVDIFLVGILSALVSLDALSTIRPGIGASFFAGVVVFTMFAAQSFDPRLIWDNLKQTEESDQE